MAKPKKLVLKEDFVIPEGTEFECIDGSKREFVNGNYEAAVLTSKDTTMEIQISEDELECADLFEEGS